MVTREEGASYKSWEIFSEGYIAIGNSGSASRMGIEHGESFKIACIKYFNGDDNFNKETMTYWGCRLFDNLTDAQASFG